MTDEPCHCRFTTRNGRPNVDCETCDGTGFWPIPQGSQNSKNRGERNDILAATRCEMMDPRHPDDPGPDRYCVEAAIGRTEDKVYVCEKCAVMMIRDGFTVHPLDHVFTK
jgi:hypothetical protein